MEKQDVIEELRRVASQLQATSLSQTQFKQYGRISTGAVENTFGSWNEAIEAAGLIPTLPGQNLDEIRRTINDDDLLREIIRLTGEIGKQPTQRQMNAKGQYSVDPYIRRYGSFDAACKIAYAQYGFPSLDRSENIEWLLEEPRLASHQPQLIIPDTHKPQETRQRKKVQFGEPLDFRGLRHAPINEQGVVYLFGLVSRELGFLIESIRTEYPDCEGKRLVDQRQQRWEQALIEFEFRSSNFKDHGHNPDGCDLIVCWIHDWQECPLEVLELKSQIQYLPNR